MDGVTNHYSLVLVQVLRCDDDDHRLQGEIKSYVHASTRTPTGPAARQSTRPVSTPDDRRIQEEALVALHRLASSIDDDGSATTDRFLCL